MPLDFEADSFSTRYFDSVQSMSRENLLRRQTQLDSMLSENMDEECRRMIALQCVTEALNRGPQCLNDPTSTAR